ncbi:MAG TPA: response regulator [Gemmataceae bacterium]|jgi:CheY-like chemotaxis protein
MRIQTIPSDSVDVLIVGDNAHTRHILRLPLERCGYRCVEARYGRQALALAHAEPPRCVLLDLLMRDLDGFSVARGLRADLRTFGTHIHCLAGQPSRRVREQAQRAGFEEFLTKPVDGDKLLEIVGPEMKRQDEVKAAVLSGLTKAQAEGVLVWLENHGCTGLMVTTEPSGFAARCVCPPGFRLDQEEDGCLRLVRIGR